eukprot:56997-Eustigmatos_ZCMA.PRE.1
MNEPNREEDVPPPVQEHRQPEESSSSLMQRTTHPQPPPPHSHNAPPVRPRTPDYEEKSPIRDRASAHELDVCSLPSVKSED